MIPHFMIPLQNQKSQNAGTSCILMCTQYIILTKNCSDPCPKITVTQYFTLSWSVTMWFLYIFVGIGPQCGGSSGGQTRSCGCALLCGHTSAGCIGGSTNQHAHNCTLMPFGHIHSGHRLVDKYVLRHISNIFQSCANLGREKKRSNPFNQGRLFMFSYWQNE